MKKRIGKTSFLLAVLFCLFGLLPGSASGETAGPSRNGDGRNRGGRAGGTAALTDAQQAVIGATKDKFRILSYHDDETQLTLEYALFVPENYDASNRYPLIMYIPDSSASGRSAEQILSGYYGADIWAYAEEQAKHECFVFVPAFSETVVDDNWNTSAQIGTAVKILSYLQQSYSIDADRLYATGQSMGCMTSLYLNSLYPDLFAASVFVSGQWDISVLAPLGHAKFFYITCTGDAKASGGQAEVMAMLDASGVAYSSVSDLDPEAGAEEKNAAIGKMLANGTNANFVRFTGLDHMRSFNYAYDLESVRDWLFKQRK